MSIANKRKQEQAAMKQRRRLENIASIVLAVILAAVPLGFSMRVLWACILWGLAWVGVLVFIFTISSRTFNWPPLVKVFLSLGLSGCLVAALFFPVRGMWRREKATALSGVLVPAGAPQSHNMPYLQLGLGPMGTIFAWGGEKDQAMLQVFYDAGIKIEFGENGETLVSTPVRDREGQIIAEITKNHWIVSPSPVVWDKNYTDDTLEVKDRRGHVVLQVRILPDRVQIAGEWRDEFGRGFRIHQDPQGNGLLSIWKEPQGEQRTEAEIKPIFKYPSIDHWGELLSGH